MNVKLNLAVTLPNLKVIRVKRAIASDRKVAKNYRRLYVGGGESKFVPVTHLTNATLRSYSFVSFLQIIFRQGNLTNFNAFISNCFFTLSMLKVEKNLEWSILKDIPFWAEPPRIGNYKESPSPPITPQPNHPPPHLPSPPRYKIWEFKNNLLTLDTFRPVLLELNHEPLLFLT